VTTEKGDLITESGNHMGIINRIKVKHRKPLSGEEKAKAFRSTKFDMCPKCIRRFNSLRFKRNAKLIPNLYPGYTAWKDEVPKRYNLMHSWNCWYTFIHLTQVRKGLLFNGSVWPDYQTFWEHALKSIPNWPGFKRTNLPKPEVEAVKQFFDDLVDRAT